MPAEMYSRKVSKPKIQKRSILAQLPFTVLYMILDRLRIDEGTRLCMTCRSLYQLGYEPIYDWALFKASAEFVIYNLDKMWVKPSGHLLRTSSDENVIYHDWTDPEATDYYKRKIRPNQMYSIKFGLNLNSKYDPNQVLVYLAAFGRLDEIQMLVIGPNCRSIETRW